MSAAAHERARWFEHMSEVLQKSSSKLAKRTNRQTHKVTTRLLESGPLTKKQYKILENKVGPGDRDRALAKVRSK